MAVKLELEVVLCLYRDNIIMLVGSLLTQN